MTITFQDGELRQLLRSHVQSTQPELLVNLQNQTLTYPDWLGSGYKRDIDLPSGIELTLHRYRLHKDLVQVCSAEQSNCFEFVFSLTTQSQYNDGPVFSDRHAHLLSPECQDSRWREFADQDYLAVDIHLDPPLLAALIEGHSSRLPKTLQNLLAGECKIPIADSIAITPEMQAALWQILQCPYQGLTQTLYLEAKSLELIALFLETIGDGTTAQTVLHQGDLERIYQARQILRSNLQTPPSLIDLARQVGLNDRKLKEGFRQAFNTTVFGYLTQQRMEKACQLLVQQRSVAAVAAIVGYASPTAFSGAFRRKFGITPKAYQLANCRGA
ncbi:helix-turn-helix transcriptional regulator [Nodosilinea sp. LEGE 07088]|uniref:helix-turn-helix transcriptional regulator n=1 Tax=Nodosilinea sp. LEGE 07088 TaxID=2777968 RepID=UPI00187F283C|nr:AraC family transcriptional regulator [Nodosilinea sp. LEGE 07088]MBE9136167.1 helix-turn-helix transcriptional regulator [Nodosilinea sp. LEGE 07088]